MHYADLFPFDKKKEVRVFYKNQLRKDEYSITETCIIDKQNQRIPIEIASGKKFKVLSIHHLDNATLISPIFYWLTFKLTIYW